MNPYQSPRRWAFLFASTLGCCNTESRSEKIIVLEKYTPLSFPKRFTIVAKHILGKKNHT